MHGVFSNRFLSYLTLTVGAAVAAVTTHLAIAQSPSQRDSTFTPDPYYVPAEPTLSGPTNASFYDSANRPATQSTPTGQTVWTPPPSKKQLAAGFYDGATTATPAPARSNQVRSLQGSVIWQPPATPILAGQNPAELTHSPLPWQQAASSPAPPSAVKNSIIRQPATPAANNQFQPTATTATTATVAPIITRDPIAPRIDLTKPQPKPIAATNAAPKPPAAKPIADSNAFVASPIKTPAVKKSPSVQRSSTVAGIGATSLNELTPASRSGSATKPRKLEKKLASSDLTTIGLNRTPPATSSKPKLKTFSLSPAETAQAALTAPNKPANAETFAPTQLLATVGGEPIFMADALLEANQLIEQHMREAPESVKKRQRKDLVKRLLPKLVEQKIMYVAALQSLPDGADIDDVVAQASKEFDDKALPELIEKAKVADKAEYDQYLRAMGSSLRKQRDAWARDQLTRYLISQEVNVNKEITHQQLLEEYRKNEAEYRFAAKSKWEQIMVRFDRFKTRQQAEEAIKEMGNRLVYGASLPAVAKKDSHGFRASDGGQHDWTGKEALVLKEIDRAIFELPIGELSDIIETRDGLHIVRVIDRREAGIKPFTEAQIGIKKRLLNEARNKAFQDHIAKMRKRVPVEYHTPEAHTASLK